MDLVRDLGKCRGMLMNNACKIYNIMTNILLNHCSSSYLFACIRHDDRMYHTYDFGILKEFELILIAIMLQFQISAQKNILSVKSNQKKY